MPKITYNAQYVKLSEVKPHPSNPRLIKDASFKKLVKSIDENPDYFEARPLIVSNRTGENLIIAGNMRYKAAKELGLLHVPAVIMSLTEEKERKIMIRDNISNGEWDWEQLQQNWNTDPIDEWGIDVPSWGQSGRLQDINQGDENSEWVGMPEFSPEPEGFKLIVHFSSEQDLADFCSEKEIEILSKQKKAWSTKFPFTEKKDLKSFKYEQFSE